MTRAEVIIGDCLVEMSWIATQSVDLVLVDLPYGSTQNAWDAVIPFEPMWNEVWRVCRGAAVFTAIQPFSSALVMSQLQHFRHEWVWEKNKVTGHLNAKKAPMRAHEVALVFSQSPPFYEPQMTVGHSPMNAYVQTSNGSNYGSTKRPAGGGSTERYPRSVQQFNVVNNDSPERIHPTQKPVQWMQYLIQTYSRPGDLVLDFAMGSGTTGVAALRAGRRFIGIELNPEYAAAAADRISVAESEMNGWREWAEPEAAAS